MARPWSTIWPTAARNARERSQEADLLTLGLDEISRVDPQPGEDEELRAEVQRLEHAEGLRTAAASRGAGARRRRRGRPTRRRTRPSCWVRPGARWRRRPGSTRRWVSWPARIEEAATLVGDVSSELSAYLSSLDADPARLEAIYERRAALRALTRKYADDVEGVIAWAEHARTRLAALDTSDELLEELDKERPRLAGDRRRAGRPADRRPGRGAPGGSPSRSAWSWPGWRCRTPGSRSRCSRGSPARDEPTVTVDGGELAVGPDGADEIELRLIAHPGAPSLPLQKGASGGELSRVMLAIEVVFAGAGGPPTLVFDEVDAGVGGQAAVEIGRRLARLARTHQVLVVTHLPQVAAFADRHLVVAKDTGGAITTSGVRIVEETERARELARMLAGLPDSDLGIAHAEELLAVADREKRA